MKRHMAFLLLFVCITGLSGCNMSDEARNKIIAIDTEDTAVLPLQNKENGEPELVLTEPPVLTVSTWNSSIEALRGTASWNYDNGDGTWSGMEADSMHPLENNIKEYMPVLLIELASDSTENPFEAVLKFDVPPDEVSIHCWSGEHMGNPSAESEDIPIHDFAIELKDSGYIYEVIAQWNKAEKYGGKVYYSFHAVPDDISAENNSEN